MRSKRKSTTTLNSGAMADVAFLLLIFFMVATTLQREKAIAMHLPPLLTGPAQRVPEKRVLSILINQHDEILIEENPTSTEKTKVIATHLKNMVSQQLKPIINIKMHPESEYQTYLEMLSHIKQAIKQTKVEKAIQLFDTPLEKLNRRQLTRLNQVCGIKIMEAEFIS